MQESSVHAAAKVLLDFNCYKNSPGKFNSIFSKARDIISNATKENVTPSFTSS